jgi:heme exporter protein CcmD
VSYVVAAYAVTLLTLLGYGWKLAADARALRQEISRTRPNGG